MTSIVNSGVCRDGPAPGDICNDPFDPWVIERLDTWKRQRLELRNTTLPVAAISAELMRLHEDPIPKAGSCLRLSPLASAAP